MGRPKTPNCCWLSDKKMTRFFKWVILYLVDEEPSGAICLSSWVGVFLQKQWRPQSRLHWQTPACS